MDIDHLLGFLESGFPEHLLPNMKFTRTWTHTWEEFICVIPLIQGQEIFLV